jgi:hypothetical protein
LDTLGPVLEGPSQAKEEKKRLAFPQFHEMNFQPVERYFLGSQLIFLSMGHRGKAKGEQEKEEEKDRGGFHLEVPEGLREKERRI